MIWTREEAVQAVKDFHSARGYQPVCSEAGLLYGLPSWHVAKRLFGSWNGLVEAAGFRPYPPRSSDLAKVLAYRDRHPGWRQELSVKAKRRLADHDVRVAA